MEWVEDESLWLVCPGFADEFVWCEAFEGLEEFGEVVGLDEVSEVVAELVVGVVVEPPDGIAVPHRSKSVRLSDMHLEARVARTGLAFALAGLGGFNAHGAGFLQAARDNEIEPDLVTATSGQIVVLAAYLKGEKNLKKGLIDKELEEDPLAQLRIALRGYPGVFEPAVSEAVARIFAPPYFGTGIDFFADRFLPAQLYKPTRTAETIIGLADTLNGSQIGVLFNAYEPTTGEGVLFGNDAARERMKTETRIGILPDQKSRDPRIAKPSGKEQGILAITPMAIEAALWLSLYGFADIPNRQMDGAYHRSCIVAELHNFKRVIVCRPLANGWSGDTLPKSYFDVQDWNTEMWFSVGYKAEVDAMKRINSLIDSKVITDPNYKLVDIQEVEPTTPAGYFNYFIERDSVFEDARSKADALFRWLKSGKVGQKP
jgi:hypothetical protein